MVQTITDMGGVESGDFSFDSHVDEVRKVIGGSRGQSSAIVSNSASPMLYGLPLKFTSLKAFETCSLVRVVYL